MKALLPMTVIIALSCIGTFSLSADPILRNGDLSEGLAGWHDDGRLTYLNPDGTEADDASSGAIPVIKLHLSGDPRLVSQEYETHDSPTTLNISVQVMPSADFKRSTDDSLYSAKWSPGGTWYWSALVVPTSDFWIRGGPGWYYKLCDALKPGKWTTVNGHFENLAPTEDHVVYFCVPPGDGSLYLKNAVVSP
jgi:hypothetical protein